MTVDLLSILACPRCRSRLSPSAQELRCVGCEASYPVVDGIPILTTEGQIAGDHHDVHKQRQASYHDHEADREYEITRPHGTAPLYEWLLREKFRRGTGALHAVLPGAVVLVVCGGSGMDAEFLAGAGARVINTDLSMGAVVRARERAARFEFQAASVVADVEQLPFRDRSVDVVYVHDGLHHLEKPLAGLAEMARVAGRAVSVNEPARAAVTAAAVRVNLALEYEEAGNLVARLRLREVAEALEASGFRIARAERYGMFYRHRPGRVTRAFSVGPFYPVARRALQVAIPAARAFGNKLTVQAIRAEEPTS